MGRLRLGGEQSLKTFSLFYSCFLRMPPFSDTCVLQRLWLKILWHVKVISQGGVLQFGDILFLILIFLVWIWYYSAFLIVLKRFFKKDKHMTSHKLGIIFSIDLRLRKKSTWEVTDWCIVWSAWSSLMDHTASRGSRRTEHLIRIIFLLLTWSE